MMRLRSASNWIISRFLREPSGSATVEFVVIVPVLFYLIFSIAEAGVLMTRSVMLDRGLDIAMRDIRLGLSPDATYDDIKDKICDAAFLLTTCDEDVLLELAPLPDAASFPVGGADCVDRTSDVEPTVTFDPGARSEIMFVRACIIVDPLFPGMGLGAMLPKDASGGYAIVTQTAFMNEPE